MTLNEHFSDELLVFGSEFGDLTNGICDFVIANAVKQSVGVMKIIRFVIATTLFCVGSNLSDWWSSVWNQSLESCHCERSEAIFQIDADVFENNYGEHKVWLDKWFMRSLVLKLVSSNHTDCFTAFAMTDRPDKSHRLLHCVRNDRPPWQITQVASLRSQWQICS